MNRRRLAFRVLVIALIAVLVIGFYLSVTHKGPHPPDDSSPAATRPQ